MAHTGLGKIHPDNAIARGVPMQRAVVRGPNGFRKESGASDRARDFQNRRRLLAARFHVRLRQLDRARFVVPIDDPRAKVKIIVVVNVVVALSRVSNQCVASLNLVAPVVEQRRQVVVHASLYVD